MDPTAFAVSRSSDIALDSLQFNEEIERLISPQPPENATSFTAVLELIPPTHATASQSTLTLGSGNPYYFNNSIADDAPPPLPPNSDSLGLSSNFSALSGKKVKDEESATKSNSSPQSVVSDPATESKGRRSEKRKERDHQKKGQGSAKRSKSERLQEAQILPYVHVRARRGHATDSHSLAERARREKINARMKLLQELVPGCSKISGTALVLDEIINHVQSLQHQVELLSMKIADSIYAPEMGSVIDDSSFPCMITPPPIWPDEQVVSRIPEQFEQQWHFNNTLHHQVWGNDAQNLTNPEVSLLSYDSSANALTLRSDPMKMELRRPPN